MAFDLDADLRAMAKRALDLLEAGTTHLADDLWREPVDRYTDPELFAREREVLFRRTPLLMGLSCDWPDLGCHRAPDPVGAHRVRPVAAGRRPGSSRPWPRCP